MVRRGSRDLQMMLRSEFSWASDHSSHYWSARESSNGTHRNFARVILSVRMAPLTVTGIS